GVVASVLVDSGTKVVGKRRGRFELGGPAADAGLTGRKIIVDTYGGVARHGGGAFSGKDPSKVDRSAAYAARYVAKNLVAAGLADRCEVQVSYAIGRARPTSIAIETFGTGRLSEDELLQLVRRYFDLRPAAIIHNLDLRRPLYTPTAAYGHFGRDDLHLPLERTDCADTLREATPGGGVGSLPYPPGSRPAAGSSGAPPVVCNPGSGGREPAEAVRPRRGALPLGPHGASLHIQCVRPPGAVGRGLRHSGAVRAERHGR